MSTRLLLSTLSVVGNSLVGGLESACFRAHGKTAAVLRWPFVFFLFYYIHISTSWKQIFISVSEGHAGPRSGPRARSARAFHAI